MTELWLGPDLNADLLPLVTSSALWTHARPHCAMLQGFQQQIGSDTENQHEIGLNFYPRLKDGGFFSGLQALGIPFAIETPGLKAWDVENGVPTGKQAAFALTQAIERIRAAGGELANYSFDDPLAASLKDFTAVVPLETVTTVLCRVAKAAWDQGIFGAGGITEAYPTCSAEQIIALFESCQQAGWSPRHLHMDIDEQHAKQVHTDAEIAADLTNLQAHCRAWDIPFGVILNGQRGDDPAAYRAGFLEWWGFVKRMLGGDPDRYILESWKKKNLPVNLPESDPLAHTGLLREVAASLPFPGEPPIEIGDSMKWILVKQVAASSGVILANPDGTTRSLNPSHNEPVDGTYGPYKWQTRPPGTDGGYERCTPGGGTVAYNPTGKEVLVFGFKDAVPNTTGMSAMTEQPLKIETDPL